MARLDLLELLGNSLISGELPKEVAKFDMNYWGLRTPCGTAACALGSAACMVEFQDAGVTPAWHSTLLGSGMAVAFDGMYCDTYTQAASFFGVSKSDAEWMFVSGSYESMRYGRRGHTAVEVGQAILRVVEYYKAKNKAADEAKAKEAMNKVSGEARAPESPGEAVPLEQIMEQVVVQERVAR